MMQSELKAAAKQLLESKLVGLGFEKGLRDGVYLKPLGDEAVLYFICRPRVSSGEVILEPMIAIENFEVRRLIGEDEPRQLEPRFVHLFLSYTVGSAITLWHFSDELGLESAVKSIVDILHRGGMPFVERWSSFRGAIELLRKDFEGDAPWGVVTHPTRITRTVVEGLPRQTDSIN